MPIIKSAIKQMRQDRKRYAQNLRTKRAMRTAIKAFTNEPSFDALRKAQSAIDTAAKKRVISKPAAARRIAHLVKVAKTAGVTVPKKSTTKTASKSKSAAKDSK